jgi:hypothetical protein
MRRRADTKVFMPAWNNCRRWYLDHLPSIGNSGQNMKTPRSANRFALRSARWMTLATTLIATTAMADVVDIVWDAGGRFERTLSVAPGKFAEVCGKLPAGLQVRWNFAGSAPLDFKVRYHVDKDVVFPSKLTAVVTAKDTLPKKIDQDYCWMWSNKSAASATIMVKLQR